MHTSLTAVLGAAAVAALTQRAPAGNLIGISLQTSDLVQVNPATGSASVIVGTDTIFASSLAYNPFEDSYYTVDFRNALVTIDPVDGSTSVAPAFGFEAVLGLTFDTTRRLVWAVDQNTDRLLSIDVETGAVTSEVGLDIESPTGLAFDAANDRLLIADSFSDSLYGFALTPSADGGRSLDLIGGFGFDRVEALTLDNDTGHLFAIDDATDQLLRVDPATGAAVAVGSTGVPFLQGLTVAPIPAPGTGVLIATPVLVALRRERFDRKRVG